MFRKYNSQIKSIIMNKIPEKKELGALVEMAGKIF